ncbi:hypothetical protein KJ562_03450, partial [Patescibacteria group bacterium]|nr:hypothetical protein [Patescibacteria group bacterium]MBU4162237.1 hypothetical protein [Patescibacteria group bacterium]
MPHFTNLKHRVLIGGLLVLLGFLFFSLGERVEAAEYYQVNPVQTVEINEWSVCKRVTNQSGNPSTFVPTKTSSEWAEFRINHPAHTSLADCCACSSGACCDGCNYRSSSYVCDTWTQYDYQCTGTACGDDAQSQSRTNTQKCTGFTESCTGSITYGTWSFWSTIDYCSITEKCTTDNATYASCYSDAVCAAPTLGVSLSANPSSGTAPLNGVDLTANVSGTATGNTRYRFDCTNNGTYEGDYTTSATSYTATDLCNYSSAGTYWAAVRVDRGGLTTYNWATITVSSPAPTLGVSLSANPSSGTAPLNGVDLTANVSGTATGNTRYRFDCTNNGTYERDYTTSATSYTATNLCDYSSTGTYTAAVRVDRGGLTAYNWATISVSSGCVCSSGTCCDGCNYRSSSYVCRASAGVCDVAEYCSGSSTSCPSDSYLSSSYVCNTWTQYDYQCTGTACGNDAQSQSRTNTQKCTGYSASCTGSITYGTYSSWSTIDDCSLTTEKCTTDNSTYASCYSDASCSVPTTYTLTV